MYTIQFILTFLGLVFLQELNLTPGRKTSKVKLAPNSPDTASHETEASFKSDVIDEEDDDKEEKAEVEMTKSKTPQVVKLARTFPRIKVIVSSFLILVTFVNFIGSE